MNNILKQLDPIVTKLGFDQLDQVEFLKGPCAKINIRPAYAVTIGLGICLLSIVIGVASGLLSSLISMIYPAYQSIKAIETEDFGDDKQWLTYWIVFSFFTILDSNFGFILSFIPLYHLVKLVFFVILFHPQIKGAQQIYQLVIHPIYIKYHAQIDSKLAQIQKQAQDKVKQQFD